MSKEINVLSLFDGMSCGQMALERAGIPVNRYLASEIDKPAMKVSAHNYPFTEYLGDVTGVNGNDLPEIDLLIGGSPCQGFSFAGKQLNFDDDRSKLFFEFLRLMSETMPRYFFLENVKMKKEYQDVISGYLGCEPIEINSSAVTAQNRKRLYWTNIPFDGIGEDKGLVIEDILDYNTEDYVYVSQTSYGQLDTKICGTNRLVKLEENYETDQEYSDRCKQVSVITHDTPSNISRQGDRVYSVRGKAPCLTTSTSCKIDMDSPDSMDWRLLTRVEQERLQTVPDHYTDPVSLSQAGKMLGNGWTVDVIVAFFKGMDF